MRPIKVYQIMEDNSLYYVSTFKSINVAAKSLGIDRTQISHCLNDAEHYKTAHGYVFRPYVNVITDYLE